MKTQGRVKGGAGPALLVARAGGGGVAVQRHARRGGELGAGRQRARDPRPADRGAGGRDGSRNRCCPSPAAANGRSRTTSPAPRAAGLLAGGASLWTDFLYDDHGPLGSPVGIAKSALVSDLAPVHGGFVYPEGQADNNGADIFRAAVGYAHNATYWRVDWNTLANADVPIAEWTFSTESATPAAGETWPANAGVHSAGIQYALVVSAQHARLLDVATGAPVAGGELHTEVDLAAHSFVVRIPTTVLPVSGSWQVRLAAGLSNAAGTEFETVPPQDGGLPGGTNVYNVTFRSYQQESELVCPTEQLPVPGLSAVLTEGLAAEGEAEGTEHIPVAECGNMWMENDQANTLATGDVSKYALAVNWSQLKAKEKTPEPQPTGYSNRWYVSPLSLGEGVKDAEGTNTYTGPTYLGRVQPYAVYVPTTYNPSKPTPLTWILHSLGANLNQYGGVAPSQLKEECEQRDSICATTEGFSDGQWYYGAAQVDFWDVWHQLATDYDLNPDATVMSGYSMGGFASYKLALEYPDLFAQAMPLEGPVICGTRVTPPIESAGRRRRMHERGQHHAADRQRQVDPVRDDLRGDRRAGPVHRRVGTGGSVQQARLPLLRGAVPGRGPHGVRAAERLRPRHLPAGLVRTGQNPRLVHVRLVSGPRLELARDRTHRRLLDQRPRRPQQRRRAARLRQRELRRAARTRTEARTPHRRGRRPHARRSPTR